MLVLTRGILKVIKELRKANNPIAVVQGNHDTGDKYGFLNGRDPSLMISPKEWGRLVSIENDDRVYGDFSRSYYYKDFDEKKIRVIILNTHDAWMLDEDGKVKYNRGENLKEHPIVGALKSEQLEWLAHDTLNFDGKDDNYGVIVISHAGLNDEIIPGRAAPINSDVAEGLIVARKNKTNYTSTPTTGDFGQNIQIDYSTANDVDIICCINGHSHKDNQIVRNGITFISTTSSRNIKDTKITDDDAWDVFNINTNDKKVMVKRFGDRGVDRGFSY